MKSKPIYLKHKQHFKIYVMIQKRFCFKMVQSIVTYEANSTYRDLQSHVLFSRAGMISQQPIQYILDTDFADTIGIRYDTHAHDLRFPKSRIMSFNNKINSLG